MRRRRFSSVVLSAALLAVLIHPGGVVARDGQRVPQSQAEWAAMTTDEQAAVMAYLRNELELQLANGKAEVREVRSTITISPSPAGSSGIQTSGAIAAVTVTYSCMVQWITIPGEGDWVRGGGWTDASDYIDRIYASRSGKPGQFLRDGALKGNWYQDSYNGVSHAENWTGYDWAFWWEYVHWVTKGWHGAYDNGSWLLGPDQYCFVETWL
jgi:predicted Fe-S protein YdhL (DUF1289 family)